MKKLFSNYYVSHDRKLCSLLIRGLIDFAEIALLVLASLVREGRGIIKSAYHRIQGGVPLSSPKRIFNF